jgi:membrane protease YdiL (CAAX protease family)
MRLPDWWHRDHPVFVPLAGFFAGMVYIIVVPGLYAAVLKALVGYERAEQLFPFVLVALALPLALLVPPRTRTFGRYMVGGVVGTVLVVGVVAAVVLYVLLKRDS